MQTCQRCKVSKENYDFHKSKDYKSGVDPICKVCWKEIGAEKRSAYPIDKKLCNRCWTIQSVEQFYPNPRTVDGYTAFCRTCYQSGNSARARKNRTGWTNEEYLAAHVAQEGKCAICKTEPIEALNADHNHSTLEKRGLLCSQCNQALGKFKDSVVILQSAIDYLNQYSKE